MNGRHFEAEALSGGTPRVGWRSLACAMQLARNMATLRAHDDPGGRRVPKIPLACGVVSSLLYVAIDLVSASRWDAYSYADQTVSELSAIGAPTRPLWVALGCLYQPLLIAFAWGVWVAAGRRRALRAAALFLVGIAAVGLAWSFFPMHLRGTQKTMTDTMHVVLAGVNGVVTLSAMGFAAAALGRPFRAYSIATMVALLAAGALTSLDAPRIAAGLPTPWVGVLERINVYGYLLWVSILGVVLLREQRRRGAGLHGNTSGLPNPA